MLLNSDQLAAIEAPDGAWAIQAGPGSGKTEVLTQRVQRLIQSGVNPEDIICLTFTVQAAREMARRAGLLRLKRGGFMTLHALAYRMLRAERKHLPFDLAEKPVAPPALCRKILREILQDYPSLPWQEAARFIGLEKRQGRTPEDALRTAGEYFAMCLALIYRDYEHQLRRRGLLDFDSLALEALQLLKSNRAVREGWQFRQVLLDEAQDTDKCQWQTLWLMTQRHGNIFAVGDPNQSIYGFRAADPAGLTEFQQRFPEGKTLYLGMNYRSSARIVDFCKAMAPVKSGLAERLRAVNNEGLPPEIWASETEADEAEHIANEIGSRRGMAILARTNRQLRAFEDALLAAAIPYRLLGRSGFWQRPEVRVALNGLKAEFHIDEGDPARALRAVIIRHQLAERFGRGDGDSFTAENLDELLNAAAAFPTVRALLQHAQVAGGSGHGDGGVALGTIHAAKGKEWPCVFVAGVTQDLFPHRRGEAEEEARLFYVACSRAAERLIISWHGAPSGLARQAKENLERETRTTHAG